MFLSTAISAEEGPKGSIAAALDGYRALDISLRLKDGGWSLGADLGMDGGELSGFGFAARLDGLVLGGLSAEGLASQSAFAGLLPPTGMSFGPSAFSPDPASAWEGFALAAGPVAIYSRSRGGDLEAGVAAAARGTTGGAELFAEAAGAFGDPAPVPFDSWYADAPPPGGLLSLALALGARKEGSAADLAQVELRGSFPRSGAADIAALIRAGYGEPALSCGASFAYAGPRFFLPDGEPPAILFSASAWVESEPDPEGSLRAALRFGAARPPPLPGPYLPLGAELALKASRRGGAALSATFAADRPAEGEPEWRAKASLTRKEAWGSWELGFALEEGGTSLEAKAALGALTLSLALEGEAVGVILAAPSAALKFGVAGGTMALALEASRPSPLDGDILASLLANWRFKLSWKSSF